MDGGRPGENDVPDNRGVEAVASNNNSTGSLPFSFVYFAG